MQRIPGLIGSVVLIASSGFTETLITAQDYAVDSDVVLESAVQEIKSIPQDSVNVIGDAVKYVGDEAVTAMEGVKAAFKSNPVDAAKQDAMLETASAWDSSNDIQLRSYKIAPAVGEDLMAVGKTREDVNAVDVSAFFDGIEFPEGSSAYYRPELKSLFVRQTMDHLFAIEDVLAEHHNVNLDLLGHQVEIETKLVEVSQKSLNELGFSWEFSSKGGKDLEVLNNLYLPMNSDILAGGLRTTAGAFLGAPDPGVLSVAKNAGQLRWDLFIGALEQMDDADVLSAPRVVTRDGTKATIKVGEERMTPKSFGVSSQNTSLYVEPSDWDPELVGVTLEVTPELRDDDLIKLKLRPRVFDLVGHDDYQISPDNATLWAINGWQLSQAMQYGRFPVVSRTADGVQNAVGDLYNTIIDLGNSTFSTVNDDANGNINNSYRDERRLFSKEELIQVPSLHAQLPYFRIRQIETQVTVSDGSTVGMGGLIYDKLETYKDKVPVLGSIPLVGRLFRSEGERSVKRNLLIFVTATQVDVNGRRNADLVLNK